MNLHSLMTQKTHIEMGVQLCVCVTWSEKCYGQGRTNIESPEEGHLCEKQERGGKVVSNW